MRFSHTYCDDFQYQDTIIDFCYDASFYIGMDDELEFIEEDFIATLDIYNLDGDTEESYRDLTFDQFRELTGMDESDIIYHAEEAYDIFAIDDEDYIEWE